jgi:class 3 adenylate cyclase/CHASE2 domain-containing sensor protein
MRKLKNLKHIFVIILISLSVIFGLLKLFSDEFNDTLNWFFIYRTSHGVWQDYFHKHILSPSVNDIVIITIDERTLNGIQNNSNDLKNLTITKETYSKLITDLESVGVKWIGFDIIFQNSDVQEQDFADTMEKYDNIVIGANYIEDLCQQAYGEVWIQLGKLQQDYPRSVTSMQCDSKFQEIYLKFQEMHSDTKKIIPVDLTTGALSATEKLARYCTRNSIGIIDCAGLPRSIYKDTTWWIINTLSSYERTLAVPITGQPYQGWKIGTGSYSVSDTELYPLALSLYLQTTSNNNGLVSTLPFYSKKLNRDFIWWKSYKTILQPYFGPEIDSYRRVSLIDVLGMNKVERKTNFKWKYVLIGESWTLIHDQLPSPVTGWVIDGIETHAHFLDGLIQDKMLKKAPTLAILIATIFLTIFTVFLYFYLPTYLSPIFAIGLLATTLYVSRYMYDFDRIVVDILPLFLSVCIATFTTTYMYRFFVVDREKRYIENAFSHYIDPKMVEMIDMEEVAVRLGGEQRDLTVFFSDIAGFTTISERLSPKNLFWLMSLYLSRMTNILKEEWGTLDKYIWDAVMGFFGAPISQTDHAIRACRTAVAMRKALPEINEEIAERGIIRIDFRIGIASGDVMIGNIGSEEHFNYTVLGDTVNLASRLEATGKEYDCHCIISEWTRRLIGENFELREIDTIAVKGKSEWIRIYELLGLLGDKINRNIYERYEQWLALYRSGKYMEAWKIWESQLEDDPVSRVMALRCVEILKWNIQVENGIYHMTHK